jgi:uncharacterized protein YuzE
MKADYDSEADAVTIEIEEVDRWEANFEVDEDLLCGVAMTEDRPVGVTLRYPAEHLDLLREAGERFSLDAMALTATVQAALAAPDHEVIVEVNPEHLSGSRAEVA